MERTSILQKLKNGDYPIITLEWRKSKRKRFGARSMIALAAGLSAFGSLSIVESYMRFQGRFDLSQLSPLANWAIVTLWILRIVIIVLIIPLFSARYISQQRETGTFDMLAITPMKSRAIFWQLFSVGFGFALAIILVSLPVMLSISKMTFYSRLDTDTASHIAMRGGFLGELIYPALAAVNASVGIFCSCMCQRVYQAIMYTYLIIVPTMLFVLPLWFAALQYGRLAWAMFVLGGGCVLIGGSFCGASAIEQLHELRGPHVVVR